MARFAPVAPIHILRKLVEYDVFGNYHLLLAHHVAKRAEEFKALFKGIYEERPRRDVYYTIIMDNSIVETGGAVDDNMIREAVEAIQSQQQANFTLDVIPVLPDVMGKGAATRNAANAGYQRWIKDDMPGKSYMLVAQGNDFQDFMDTIDCFFVYGKGQYNRIEWVGIPRWLVEKGGCSRVEAVRYVRMVAPQVKVHLLGFSTDIYGDMCAAREPGVSGIDSAVPVRYDNVLVPSTTDDQIGLRGNWFESGEFTLKSLENIKRVRSWMLPDNPYMMHGGVGVGGDVNVDARFRR